MRINNELFLNEEIYSVGSIRGAVEAFEGLCKIVLRQESGYIICEFSDCVEDLYLTMREFENYLIGYMKQNGY